MANSVEIRSPFLDKNVYLFMLSLPLDMKLKKGKLSIEEVESEMKGVEPKQQMLLLNLLGGRLPLGHRLHGEDSSQNIRRVKDQLDRVLRRMRRVAEMLESELSA